MANYFVFLQKEMTENLRTKKVLALACVFLFFAFSSPLLARFMQEFMAWAMAGEAGVEVEALLAMIPPPVWVDSYAQFYGNMSQIGAITIVLLFMSTVLREKRSGTADLVFSKGLSAASFILAKFTLASALAVICLIVSVLVAYLYTYILFEYAGQMLHVLMGGLAYGLFLLMVLSVVILCSAIAKSTALSAVLGFFSFIFLLLINSIPRVGRFFPGNLASRNLEITMGTYYGELVINIIAAIAVITLSLGLSVYIVKRQEV